jgi:penicillin-binding protein 1A
MQGPVTLGTAAGLMQRLRAAEMGGKTGTTNDNADAWFMGYVPQLLAGTWIGCDDRFIRIENDLGMGGQAARPIWEAFFKKVYADKTLGIDRDAVFAKPADLQNEMNNADISSIIQDDNTPTAEGENIGAGSANDFGTLDTSHEYIPAESQAPDEDAKAAKQKDSAAKKGTKIGDPAPVEKKKKGFFKKLFGKKEQSANDY